MRRSHPLLPSCSQSAPSCRASRELHAPASFRRELSVPVQRARCSEQPRKDGVYGYSDRRPRAGGAALRILRPEKEEHRSGQLLESRDRPGALPANSAYTGLECDRNHLPLEMETDLRRGTGRHQKDRIYKDSIWTIGKTKSVPRLPSSFNSSMKKTIHQHPRASLSLGNWLQDPPVPKTTGSLYKTA